MEAWPLWSTPWNSLYNMVSSRFDDLDISAAAQARFTSGLLRFSPMRFRCHLRTKRVRLRFSSCPRTVGMSLVSRRAFSCPQTRKVLNLRPCACPRPMKGVRPQLCARPRSSKGVSLRICFRHRMMGVSLWLQCACCQTNRVLSATERVHRYARLTCFLTSREWICASKSMLSRQQREWVCSGCSLLRREIMGMRDTVCSRAMSTNRVSMCVMQQLLSDLRESLWHIVCVSHTVCCPTESACDMRI